MRKTTCVIMVILCAAACHSPVDMTLLSNWKSLPAPVSSDSIAKNSSSVTNWWVYLKNDMVRVSDKGISPRLPFRVDEDKDDKIQISFLKVDNGFLVGFYRGEWGGSLNWFSSDGKKRYKISEDEVVQFIKRSGKNYALQGLAHAGMSKGSIINIEKINDKWVAQQYLELPTAPYAITLDKKNNFLIITSKSLFMVDSSATIHTLINRGLWWTRLHPTSIVVKDSLVFAGMSDGVYQYNSESGEKSWLTNH
ncbi:hypothetical protein [Mucilaginibacter flavidus]|uniref:hypothetical protein n=1 Tax=Mucilaginibacter flavidus TaxID=2949309 RepID=UPI00209217BF|nr:hypothetical protein [Mucilaginibacter flavidus]MCO5946497.1 hypothetical protein [Mucilaginibacter flavidus]